jgi:hypothetical protein
MAENLPIHSATSVDDKLEKYLNGLLHEALLERTSLQLKMQKAIDDIKTCHARLQVLGLNPMYSLDDPIYIAEQIPVSNKSSDAPTSVFAPQDSNEVLIDEAPLTTDSVDKEDKTITGSTDEASGKHDEALIVEAMNGASAILLKILAAEVRSFGSETAAQAYAIERPEAKKLKFADLRNRIGQALSRLASKGKVAKFQETGRPSQVRYLNTEWVGQDGAILPEYKDELGSLEPIAPKNIEDQKVEEQPENPAVSETTASSQEEPDFGF